MKRIFLEDLELLTPMQELEKPKHLTNSRAKYFINRLPGVVWVRERNGLLTKIESDNRGDSAYPYNFFYIADTINGTNDAFNGYRQQALKVAPHMRTGVLRFVAENTKRVSPRGFEYTLSTLSRVSPEQLAASNGIVYLEEHDLVVIYDKSKEQASAVFHPNSLEGYTAQAHTARHPEGISNTDLVVSISIIDNESQFGSKWTVLNGRVFKVVARTDPNLTSGIYYSYNKVLLKENDLCNTYADRLDFKDREKLELYKLYDSESEAIVSITSNAQAEAQAKIAEAESKRATSENNYRKAQQEKENLEKEYQYKQQRFKQDNEKLERDNDRLRKEHDLYLEKSRVEYESLLRKNTADIFKYVPMVLSAIACVATLISKKQ